MPKSEYTHPVSPKLVSPIRPRLLDVPCELFLLIFWDLSEWQVCDIEDPVVLSMICGWLVWIASARLWRKCAYLVLRVSVVDYIQETLRSHRIPYAGRELRPTLGRASLRDVNDWQICPLHCIRYQNYCIC